MIPFIILKFLDYVWELKLSHIERPNNVHTWRPEETYIAVSKSVTVPKRTWRQDDGLRNSGEKEISLNY